MTPVFSVSPKADATVTLPKMVLAALNGGVITVEQGMKGGKIKVEGNAEKVAFVFAGLDTFTLGFPILTPAVER